MKNLPLHVTALSILLTGSAMAADMRMPAKAPAPAAVPVAAFSWTGCYVGGGGGYGMYNQDVTVRDPGGFALTDEVTFGGRGWFGTVQVGCDFQVGANIVVGAFADYDFSNLKGRVHDIIDDHFGRERLKSSWAAGARIGWLPLQQQQLMVFVSGGYTEARFGEIRFHHLDGSPDPQSIGRHTYEGWFIGTGYEYALGWFPNLTWKTEYRFADYGRDRLAVLFDGVETGLTVDARKYVHTVRSELVWRFNFGGRGGVVARY